MACGDLSKRTASDKVLCYKAFNIAKKILNMTDIGMALFQWSTKFFIKSSLLHMQIILLVLL